MKDTPRHTVQALRSKGRLTDIVVTFGKRRVPMLGPAGPNRETGFLPPERVLPGPGPEQSFLPVLIGAGTGAALAEVLARLENAYGADFFLAVVDKEDAILAASDVRERFSAYGQIFWIHSPDHGAAIKELTRLQNAHGGKALMPLLNPFYLRLDREYYGAVNSACEASSKANFWEKAQYPKFRGEQPRLLLLTSQYFLMGEIIAACRRMELPHRLLRVPEGETGQTEFVERLLCAVLEFKPDFVFTINHLGVDREGVLAELLERLRLPLASWFVDNPHLILYLYSCLVSPWTAIFSWDADNIDSLKALGFEHVFYLPLGVDVTRFRPLSGREIPLPGLPGNWDRRIAFVGNSMFHKVRCRLERSAIPDVLRESYSRLAAGFSASEERSVRAYIAREHSGLLQPFDSMKEAEDRLNYETLITWEATLQYRLSRIRAILPFTPLIVGDDGWHALLGGESSRWRHHAELNYYEQLPRFYPCAAINYNCTSKQMKGAVNQRVFDVPATGAFLLTDYREQVENLFEPEREIICYHDAEEAAALAGEYLARPQDRLRIAGAARKRVLLEHSYDYRLRALIREMRAIYG